jgi:plasmid stabilization system protein ParE
MAISRFRVVITPDAQHDLREIRNYLRERAPLAAQAWSKGIRAEIHSLSKNPERCHRAPESVYFEDEIRELFYGKGNRGTYRILFAILAKTVMVLHVRHGSRRELRDD